MKEELTWAAMDLNRPTSLTEQNHSGLIAFKTYGERAFPPSLLQNGGMPFHCV